MASSAKVPIEAGLIARASQAARYLLTGQPPGTWMGAGVPLPPILDPAPTEPRAFDYPVSLNTMVAPRSYEPVSFAQLRGLADASDLVRLCIETRKDQMEALDWSIVRKDGAATTDGEAAQLTDLFQSPDRARPFGEWLRMLLEEVLVVDAPAISLQRTVGGGLYALRLIKGDTITVKVDDAGDIPAPPGIAYQQVIKGVPYENFTTDELVYAPRNRRVGRLYGFSPVEQIVMSVNIALRRQASQLAAYTEGNIPDFLMAAPESWTPDQIAKFQKFWDALYAQPEGVNLARRMKMVPGGSKPELLHKAPLFDEGDEWLARVVCYAFSLPPTPFAKSVQRGTSESLQESALEEGLAPLMRYVERTLTRIIAQSAGAPAYAFQFGAAADTDAFTQAQIDHIYVSDGVQSPAQIAQARGWDYDAPAPITPVAPVATAAPTDPTTEARKLLKQVRALRGRAY